MARIYIAVNGDDVGSNIGNAIASNDHMALSKLSSSIKDSHSMIDEWVQNKGGETITSNGDEGLYIVPEECLEELEQIRSQYQQMSGHTLTIGVGNSMADASKALIYGKLNEKNQVVHYEPAIDDMLSDEQVEEAEQTEAQAGQGDMQEQPAMESQNQLQQPSQIEDGQQKQYLNEEQMGAEPAAQPLDTGDTKDFADPDDNIEGAGNEVGEADDQDQEFIDDDSTDEYEKTKPEQAIGAVVDQESDGEPAQELGDAEAMNPEEETEHDAIEGQMDDMDQDNIEHDAEPDNEDEDALVDMVHQDMEDAGEGYESEQTEDMGEEDQMSEEQAQLDDHADMKSAIMETLQIFRSHKSDLDLLASANPDLHAGLISMLQHMIEMGKRLQGSGSNGNDADELNQFAEEFPDAEGNEDAEQDEEMIDEEMDEHNEDKHGEDPDEDSAIENDDDEENDATPDDGDEGDSDDDDSGSDDNGISDDDDSSDDKEKQEFPKKDKLEKK